MVSEALAAPMCRSTGDPKEERAWRLLESVMDPEIPVLSVLDLGVVRYVHAEENGLRVGITPTYSGCPATEVIRHSILEALRRDGLDDVMVETVLSPPWSSDWLSAEGRRKLAAFGICPPAAHGSRIACPRCGSRDAERLSEFGSTPCKAHYRCSDCLEPFDVFKCI
jgi:ring-1,2-phenylacetyl-CoA epoxidase subunit PaaD